MISLRFSSVITHRPASGEALNSSRFFDSSFKLVSMGILVRGVFLITGTGGASALEGWMTGTDVCDLGGVVGSSIAGSKDSSKSVKGEDMIRDG